MINKANIRGQVLNLFMINKANIRGQDNRQ